MFSEVKEVKLISTEHFLVFLFIHFWFIHFYFNTCDIENPLEEKKALEIFTK